MEWDSHLETTWSFIFPRVGRWMSLNRGATANHMSQTLAPNEDILGYHLGKSTVNHT